MGDGGGTPWDAEADGGSVAGSIVRRDGTESGAPPGIGIASGRTGQFESWTDSVLITGQTWRLPEGDCAPGDDRDGHGHRGTDPYGFSRSRFRDLGGPSVRATPC